MLMVDDDEVILAVLRPQEIWQQLSPPGSQSRDPYRESLVPLLHWLDRLQKRKGRELSEEEGRNNCRPFVHLEFTPRPAKDGEPRTNIARVATAPIGGTTPSVTAPGPQGVVAGGKAYVLRMFDSAFVKGTLEMSCTLVTASGAYHFVKQSRDYGSAKSAEPGAQRHFRRNADCGTSPASRCSRIEEPRLRSTAIRTRYTSYPPVPLRRLSHFRARERFRHSKHGSRFKSSPA